MREMERETVRITGCQATDHSHERAFEHECARGGRTHTTDGQQIYTSIEAYAPSLTAGSFPLALSFSRCLSFWLARVHKKKNNGLLLFHCTNKAD